MQSMKALKTPYHVVPDIASESSLYRQERDQAIFPLLSSFLDSADYLSNELRYASSFEDSKSSVSQWLSSSPVVPELDSFDSPGGTWGTLSPSPYPSTYVTMDENNYLTWPYDASNINGSFYSTHSPHPASPSMSIVSASTEDGALSPPPSLAEFANVFDFDFSSSLPNEMPPSSWLQVPGQHPTSHHPHSFSPPSCPSPAQSAASAEGSDSRPARSRESSPNQSDNDQNNPRRRYPCLILGCTRRFTSQYTLKVHMEAHKPKPRVSFPCTLGCSEKFSRQHDRLRHEVAKHGKVCEFSCEDCGRFFSTKKTLGNHKCPVAQGTRWVNS